MNKTQTVSKKAKIAILVLFELYVCLSGTLEFLTHGASETFNKPAYYPILLAISVLMSIYFLILSWLWERLQKFFASRAKRKAQFFTSERWKLIICYMFLFAPTLFAKILIHIGLPISQFFYFLGTTLFGAMTWAILDLRSSTADVLGNNKE